MKVSHLKVRPRKEKVNAPCAVQLATMLNCWASFGDTRSQAQCADAARALHTCMGGAARMPKPRRSTINYHLARLEKKI
ncbi:hypothetical protein DL93DRAFT_2051244 [Clavulina sp. PMI_390]|nr:hypothetical protein DL93DRAFT_2051244 [Clavulina sp. PMI_390]